MSSSNAIHPRSPARCPGGKHQLPVKMEGVPLGLQMKDESVGGDQTKVPMIVAT